jgi:putative tryptophan/tyrosine transport system substrate-binding protein
VSVIAAIAGPATRAAKSATTTVPIVFLGGFDPVQSGFVASLSRPGSNVTGVTPLLGELLPKQLEILHETLPAVTVIAMLVNPANPRAVEIFTKSAQAAARIMGLQVEVLRARNDRDFDSVFAALARLRAGALLIAPDNFLYARHQQLIDLSLRAAVPVVSAGREFPDAGGLFSYEGDPIEAFRIFGDYVVRILKGEKPADLPVQQSTHITMVLNLKTAKALGIEVPTATLLRATEVIE